MTIDLHAYLAERRAEATVLISARASHQRERQRREAMLKSDVGKVLIAMRPPQPSFAERVARLNVGGAP
jgi:hypothetical protein